MGRYAQVVIGPAGCGKSTYCQALQAHCQAAGRACHVVNMDPAADNFGYEAALDLRALVTVDDVMEAMELGPNGALMCAMEFLEEHIPDWLAPELEGFAEDSYSFTTSSYFDRPRGCTWHHYGNVELWTQGSATMGCTERDYAGCLCKTASVDT